MTYVFASLTSKSNQYDTCVYVDNFVETEYFLKIVLKNRHSIHFIDKYRVATQIAKKLKWSILLCEVIAVRLFLTNSGNNRVKKEHV